MIKWPDKAKRSLAVFFAKWNDFDVFVEDTAQYAETLYGAFLSRITAGHCKIERVIPLGDRKRVLEAATADTAKGGRPRLYLVDGDLDLIAGKTLPVAPRLFVHQVYHIENYFLCEGALVKILHEENPRFSEAQVRQKLNFQSFITSSEGLKYLFAVFGLTALLTPALPTISLGIGRFCTDQRLDLQKISDFCRQRNQELLANSSDRALREAQQQIDGALANYTAFMDLIAAREYSLPLLRWWVRDQGLQLPNGKESLLVRLAKVCDLDRHQELVSAVKHCAQAKAA